MKHCLRPLSLLILVFHYSPSGLAQEKSLSGAQEMVEKKSPVAFEIFCPDSSTSYRSEVSLRARFHNQSDKSLVLCLDNSLDFSSTDRSVIWKTNDNMFAGFSYHDNKKTGFVIQPHETLEVILPPRLFFLGKHRIVAKYKDEQNAIPMIESNAFEIEVIDHPLNPEKSADINTKTKCLLEFWPRISPSKQGLLHDAGYKKNMQNELLVYSPYSVPLLLAALQDKYCQPIAVDIVETLGMIADKERAARIGYIRDTSSADLVVEQIGKEPDAGVKTALLKIVGKFFDVLTLPQKETLEKTVLAQLAQADAGVRVQAALTFLELFPKQRTAVETALAKADFADEAGRKAIAEALAKAKVSNP